MANFDKWAQSPTGHRPAGRSPSTKAKNSGVGKWSSQAIQSPFGQSSPFSTVGVSQGAAHQGGPGSAFGSIGQALGEVYAPPVMTPGQAQALQAMGPNASLPGVSGVNVGQLDVKSIQLNKSMNGTGMWQGGQWTGPLAAPPKHHGWAGLKDYSKAWTQRIMGAFPQLYFASGYRSPAQNKAAGGVANSGHMRGDKIDLGGKLADLKVAAAWARHYGARVLIHPPGKEGYHLDISWAPIGRV